MGFGDYPADYNPKVHGIYDPARYYGKPGKKFVLNVLRYQIFLIFNQFHTFLQTLHLLK